MVFNEDFVHQQMLASHFLFLHKARFEKVRLEVAKECKRVLDEK